MAASSGSKYDSWLSEKLTKLNTDVDLEVFVSYIRGILEEDSSDEEKGESIEGFLAEITDEDLTSHVAEILEKWLSLDGAAAAAAAVAKSAGQMSMDERLAGIMEAQKNTLVKHKTVSDDDRKRKAAILQQYAQVSDGEETDEDFEAEVVAAGGATSKAPPSGGTPRDKDADLLVKNMNALLVKEREISQRETERLDAAKKKEKDKTDREKQKQKAQDRKESEKKRTQKGEKRR